MFIRVVDASSAGGRLGMRVCCEDPREAGLGGARMRIPMKGILRAVKPREEGSIPNNIKPYETRTPALFSLYYLVELLYSY
jgi:hypothetical protein